MSYQEYMIFNPKVEEVATDILCVEFWKPQFCEMIIEAADSINAYQSNPTDPVPGQELRIDKISNDFYISYCKHWKTVIQPILEQYYMLPSEQWFIGWKVPFIIKYEMDKQRDLRPHMDGSLITGTVRLNDSYSGGELVFPRQKYKNNAVPIGSMLIWPSSIQHLHYSDTLQSGTKYSLVSWTKNDKRESGINYEEV
jgi:hypothetical protein